MGEHDGIPLGRGCRQFTVYGLVQGVGFRPFVYALARELALSGSVRNTPNGVVIEVEGAPEALDEFGRQILTKPPPAARVHSVTWRAIACRGGTEFAILTSREGAGRTMVSPDIGTCPDCLAELANSSNRRYRHPFISCTNCGPRFTVICDMPYDRPSTTMVDLPFCAQCRAEYRNPNDRRFHSQTIACWNCGPTLTLRGGAQEVKGEAAIADTRRLLADGQIVAVKGIGGYHLTCDASNPLAVKAIRQRKDRGDKPFAVMVAHAGDAERIAQVSGTERALLADCRHPIVLLPKRAWPSLTVAHDVAPGYPDLGVMTAYTPVHRLLFGLPTDQPGPRVLVMTSGNVAGEPIVIDDSEAFVRLANLADAWLYHDRPIHVPCDDSVVRIAAGKELPVRRSRGYAPMPVALPFAAVPALAVGGDVKNTFCVADGGYAWLSAHIGDMDHQATLGAFDVATAHLAALTRVRPRLLVADRHPDYRSASWARRNAEGRPVRTVQHHHAHIASVMAENGHDGASRVIGFAFDGNGFGDDGTVWGGEVLLADYDGFERAAHLKCVPLPGGDSAVRNPCRMALSHLRAANVEWSPTLPSVAACTPTERGVLRRQLETGLGCTPTSSMGRLFDAMSSLVGTCHRVAYEAEAATRFEGLARSAEECRDEPYEFRLLDGPNGGLIDSGAVIAAAAADVLNGVEPAVIAATFHAAVAELVASVARHLRAITGLTTVALSGGVFLNALLTTLCIKRLERDGFLILRHRLVPPSDAGLALGQIAVAARQDDIRDQQ